MRPTSSTTLCYDSSSKISRTRCRAFAHARTSLPATNAKAFYIASSNLPGSWVAAFNAPDQASRKVRQRQYDMKGVATTSSISLALLCDISQHPRDIANAERGGGDRLSIFAAGVIGWQVFGQQVDHTQDRCQW